jgi:hypothetical protein
MMSGHQVISGSNCEEFECKCGWKGSPKDWYGHFEGRKVEGAKKGVKGDESKPPVWDFLCAFPGALRLVGEVHGSGGVKYGMNNWKDVPEGSKRYMNAFARHAMALASGEEVDHESGSLHKVHMIWNLMASLELEINEGRIESSAQLNGTDSIMKAIDSIKRQSAEGGTVVINHRLPIPEPKK